MYHCYTRLGNFSVTICGTVSLLHQIWQLENNLLKICCSLCETVSPVTPNFKNGKMFWKTCWHENFCVTIFDDVSLLHQIWKLENTFFKICCTLCETVSQVTPDFEYFVWLSVIMYHCYTRFENWKKTLFEICCSNCETVLQVTPDFKYFVWLCVTLYHCYTRFENWKTLFSKFVAPFVRVYHRLH